VINREVVGPKTVTPLHFHKFLQRLCVRIGSRHEPVRLPVSRMPDSVPLECFENVNRCIEQQGGTRQYGWLLWEWPHVMVEAEFHCVWRDPGGQLREITGSAERELEVLFVPDDTRIYAGRRVDNLRLAIRDDQLVHDLIWCAAERYRFSDWLSRGGNIASVPDSEFGFARVHELACLMIAEGKRASDDCGCGSGKRYKRCHGLRQKS
jgi:hypothetical protein